jgi:O-Antigen ligase
MRRFSLTWWQTAWLLLFLSGLVFRGRTAAEINNSAIDAWALYRIGCVFLVGAILFVRLTLKRTRWMPYLFSGYVGLFVLFPFVALVSTAWSVLPPWTLYKSVEFLVDVCTLAAILPTIRSVEDYKKLIDWSWILLGLLVCSAWVGAVIDPSEALFSDPNLRVIPLPMRLVGVFPVVSCNDLSEICATLGLVALCRMWIDPERQHSKFWYRLLFAASMVSLVITQTRGSFIAFFVGLVVLLLLTRRYALAAAGGFMTVMVGGALLLLTNFGSAAQNFFNRGQNAQQAGGFSGRLQTWTNSYYAIMEHPILGYGGFAGSRFVVLSKNSSDSSSLNSFIDCALNLGIVGVIIILVVVVLAGWTLFRKARNSRPWTIESAMAVEMFVAFIVLLIRSVESSNLITHPMLSFLTIIGAAEALRYKRNSVLATSPQRGLSWQSDRPLPVPAPPTFSRIT